jgi:protein transport protein SEC24
MGSEKEKTLLEPQDFMWRKLGQDCASAGVCVDLFFFPSAYMDVATLGIRINFY